MTGPRRLAATLASAAVLLTACQGHPGNPAVAAPTTGPVLSSSPAPASPAARPQVADRDGPANPAACALVSWTDLPGKIRSARPPTPRPLDDDPAGAACRLDNSDLGEITFDPSCPGPLHACDYTPAFQLFIVQVVLSAHMAVDPTSYRGDPDVLDVREVQVADAEGSMVRERDPTGQNIPRCLVGWRTQKSKAMVIITNNRFGFYDPCALALLLALRLAPRIH